MNDFITIFITIFVITALIYLVYKLLLGSMKSTSRDEDLQITAEGLLQQITVLYKQRKYSIAEAMAKKYLDKKPKEPTIRNLLGKIYFAQERYYDAIDQINILVKNNPLNFDAQIFLSNCYILAEKPMKAIETLQNLLNFDPENIVAIKELAKVYFDTNQKLSSRKMYEKLDALLDNNQEKAKNRIKIAEIFTEFQDYESAVDYYNSVLDLYPTDISVKKRLAELYKIQSNFDAAIIDFH